MDKFYNTKEAAERLRIPVPTLRLYRAQGMIKGAKPGKIWIHSEADLQAFYNENRTKEANPSDYLVNQRKG